MPETHTGVPEHLERRLKRSLGDEIRADVMRLLDERPASIRELSELLGEKLSVIAPHVLDLWKNGTIARLDDDDDGTSLADRRFRAVTVLHDDEEWGALDDDERYAAAVRFIEVTTGESLAALRSGHLTARPDSHTSWMAMAVDEEGWREMMAMLGRAFREANAIKARAATRLREAGERGTPIVVSMLGYERSR